MDYIVNSHPFAGHIQLGLQTTGKKNWHQNHWYPIVGGGLYYANLNSDILGEVKAVYSFFNLQMIRKSNFTFNYQISPGVAFLNSPFDENENYYNIAIGNRINAFFRIHFNTSLKISDKIRWNSGLAISHYSNGGMRMPNLGINLVTLYTGVQATIGNTEPTYIVSELPQINKKLFITADAGFTMKKVKQEIYPVSSARITALKQVTNRRRFGLGMELFYDRTTYKRLELENVYDRKTSTLFRPGIFVCQDFVVGKTDGFIQIGYYLHAVSESDKVVYSRFGIRYWATEKTFIYTSVVTHFFKAQFIDAGIGVRIFR